MSRIIQQVLPLLEQAGRDTIRRPDPGRKQRRSLDTLLHDTPELALIVDSFEQRLNVPKFPMNALGGTVIKSALILPKAKWRSMSVMDAWWTGGQV